MYLFFNETVWLIESRASNEFILNYIHPYFVSRAACSFPQRQSFTKWSQELPIDECNELAGFFNLSSPELFQEFNISCIGHAQTLAASVLWKATFLMLMAGLTIVSNGWMMISIQKKQRRWSCHLYTLVFHLAMADIFVAVFCIFGEGFWWVSCVHNWLKELLSWNTDMSMGRCNHFMEGTAHLDGGVCVRESCKILWWQW